MRFNNQEEKELMKFLRSQRLMALAVVDGNFPWVCTVYYAIDENFNFYFVSSPNSNHSKFLEKNNSVACAICDSHTPNSAKKVGVQLMGKANLVKSWERTKILLKIWYKAAPGMENIVNIKNMMNKVVTSRIYEVNPTKIKFFNEELFPKEKYKEFRF